MLLDLYLASLKTLFISGIDILLDIYLTSLTSLKTLALRSSVFPPSISDLFMLNLAAIVS